MSSEYYNVFKKSNPDLYLKDLSKEYKKLAGRNMPAEIILIGGAPSLYYTQNSCVIPEPRLFFRLRLFPLVFFPQSAR